MERTYNKDDRDCNRIQAVGDFSVAQKKIRLYSEIAGMDEPE